MITSEVYVEGDGRQLAGTFFLPDNPSGAAVLMTHGFDSNTDSYAQYAEAATEVGVTCLTFNLAGHGESEGDRTLLTISDHRADMQAAYDVLAAQADIDPDRIGALGASFGGYLALMLTTERPVKSLMLRAPAVYADGIDDVPRRDFDTQAITEFREELRFRDRNHTLRAVRDFDGEVTVAISEKDESIPRNCLNALIAASKVTSTTKVIYFANQVHRLTPEAKTAFAGFVQKWAARI